MSLSNNLKIILLAGIAIGVLTLVYYINYKKEVNISNWETYDNGFGYEFKHPKDWYILEYDRPRVITILSEKNLPKAINLLIMDNPKELPLEEWLNEKPSNTHAYQTIRDQINQKLIGEYYGSTYTEKKVIINGIESIDEMLVLYSIIPIRRSVIIPAGKRVYAFSPVPIRNRNFDKMLSTFKLVEK